jgi:hypothetical protein
MKAESSSLLMLVRLAAIVFAKETYAQMLARRAIEQLKRNQ